MNRIKRFTRIALGLALAMTLVWSATATVGAQDAKVLRVVMGAAGTEVDWDHIHATDTTSHTFLEMMYPSLAPLDPVTAEPQHGMATEWEISEDLLVYTFTVKQGVPWVVYDPESDQVVQVTDQDGNVRYVTAHDFVYGALRMMDPASASEYGYLAADWVEGGWDYLGGEGSRDDPQIVALDDYTVQITAPEPAGFLLQVYGFFVFDAQPQWAIEEYGDAWVLPGNFPAYGNFVLKAYEPGSRVVAVKNPFWEGTESHPVPKIDVIEATFLDQSAALAAFEAGEVDTTESVPLPDLDRLRVERPDELYIGADNCTYYYGFNVEKEPVNNVHMRRALSTAIDRQLLIDAVLKGGQQPAGFFSRPNFAASATQEEYPDLGVYSDPMKAQEELNAYFEETGTSMDDLPPITLMHNTSEGHALIAQAIQQMWDDTLGIEVEVTNQEWQTYLDLLNEDSPQVWRLGWCMDYPDPNNFLGDVFRSDSGNNHTNWGNEEFDALIAEAKGLTDTQARKDLYARAEHILTWEDAAMAPIYFYTKLSMIADYVDANPSITGIERYDTWDIP